MWRTIVLVGVGLFLPLSGWGEDYDVYDTYGRRAGSLRSRGSTVHVIESPSPFESVGGMLDGIGRMRQLRTQREILEAQKELLEAQQELLREQKEQKETTKQTSSPVVPEVVDGIMAAFYDDASYEQFLNSLSDEELRAFWRINTRAVTYAPLNAEAGLHLSREEAKISLLAMWKADKAETKLRLQALPQETFTLLGLDHVPSNSSEESWEQTRLAWRKQIVEEMKK